MAYIIGPQCIDVKDRACTDECPTDCIYEGGRMLYIHPDECIDCAACVHVCPMEAIALDVDCPEHAAEFASVNAEFFTDAVSGLGSPGGAARVGSVVKDHPLVEQWVLPN